MDWIGLDQLWSGDLDWIGSGLKASGFGSDWIVSNESISYSGRYLPFLVVWFSDGGVIVSAGCVFWNTLFELFVVYCCLCIGVLGRGDN